MKLIVSNGNGLCKCIPLSSGVKKKSIQKSLFHFTFMRCVCVIEKAVKENKIKQIISAPNKVKWTMYRLFKLLFSFWDSKTKQEETDREQNKKDTHSERDQDFYFYQLRHLQINCKYLFKLSSLASCLSAQSTLVSVRCCCCLYRYHFIGIKCTWKIPLVFANIRNFAKKNDCVLFFSFAFILVSFLFVFSTI